MSSNSIRVGAELFSLAQQHGALMSRSAAQQVEHWARIGAALEATGLSVADVARLLRGGSGESDAPGTAAATDLDLWAVKRQQQAKDLRSVRAGRQPAAAMSWFAGGKAKAAKLVDSPY
jgi:hypothetical protein